MSGGWRRQVGLFAAAYLAYSAARWIAVGDLATAREHADRILDLERDLNADIESAVQEGLTGTPLLWLLNHLYLLAQLVVVPGALVWLYRKDRPVYRRLRDTVLATWLVSVPIYAAFRSRRRGSPTSDSWTPSRSRPAWRSTRASPRPSTTNSRPCRACTPALPPP
jgi:hypothetical protein